MKKRIIYTLCCALMVTGLVGCGNQVSESTPEQETTISQSAAGQESATETTSKEDKKTSDTSDTDGSKTENTTDADKLYSEALDNMSKINNYHSEQNIDIKIKSKLASGETEVPSTLQTSADISKGKTSDGKDCIYVHSTSTASLFGFDAKVETYESQDPDGDDGYYEFYQKQETSTLAEEPQWFNVTNDESKSNAYSETFPSKIDGLKINEKESTNDVTVLEGNTDAAVDIDALKETYGTIEDVKYETTVKVKIDNKLKVIVEIVFNVSASGKTESGTDSSISGTVTQKNTKINENINVEIPDSVRKSAK